MSTRMICAIMSQHLRAQRRIAHVFPCGRLTPKGSGFGIKQRLFDSKGVGLSSDNSGSNDSSDNSHSSNSSDNSSDSTIDGSSSDNSSNSSGDDSSSDNSGDNSSDSSSDDNIDEYKRQGKEERGRNPFPVCFCGGKG